MSTAAPPIARPGGFPGARGAKRAGWAAAGLLALLLLVATVATPRPEAGCGDDGSSTGDVTAVGRYTRPLTFGGATLYPGQLVFADVVAKRTKWDLGVIRAQVFNEMNGAAALGRVREHNNNWLNVGYFDQLRGGGAYQSSPVWRDPIKAGNATADWIQGKRTLAQIGAPSIRDAYAKGASAGPNEQVRLLQNSGWASSRYPDLPAIYQRISGGGGGKVTGGTQVAVAAPATPGPATGSVAAPSFDDAVRAAKDATGSPVGFAVVDETGTTVAEYHATVKNTGRSMSKSLILVALTQRAKGRELTASEKALATRMIEDSDNQAANQLFAEVGKTAVNRVADQAGMKQWNADARMGKSIAFKLGTASVSAEDFARFFARIDTMLSARHRDFATGLLGNIQGAGRYGVLDAGFTGQVLSKGGWNVDATEGTVNQAAQVTVGGKKYGISVVQGDQKSLEAGGRQIATIAKAIQGDLQAGGGTAAGAAPAMCNAAAIGGGITAVGAIAHKYLGATGPDQMPGFTGAFPVGQWCAWFVTNVLRTAGVDMPVMPYSGTPYDWAKAHPDAWTITKPIGQPSRTGTPPIGSLFMYGPSQGASKHVNMVEKTYPDGSFDLIGGNQGSGCTNGSCVSEHKSCKLVGWKSSTAPHVDCGDDRPIWGIVTPHDPKGARA